MCNVHYFSSVIVIAVFRLHFTSAVLFPILVDISLRRREVNAQFRFEQLFSACFVLLNVPDANNTAESWRAFIRLFLLFIVVCVQRLQVEIVANEQKGIKGVNVLSMS